MKMSSFDLPRTRSNCFPHPRHATNTDLFLSKPTETCHRLRRKSLIFQYSQQYKSRIFYCIFLFMENQCYSTAGSHTYFTFDGTLKVKLELLKVALLGHAFDGFHVSVCLFVYLNIDQ